MRKNAEKVIAAFNDGKPAKGDSKATIRTDGDTVWSYAMPIAGFMPDGTLWILSYDKAPTATTRSQVRALETAVASGSLKCKHEDCNNYLHEVACLTRK